MPHNKLFCIFGKKRVLAALILSILILTATVAGTVAYLAERSAAAENTLVPVMVDSAPVATAAGGVAVQNTGDITAYLRATVVVTWVAVDEDGNATANRHSTAPVLGVDYQIGYQTANGWGRGTDGFWYYIDPVGAGGTTPELVASITRLDTATVPEGYRLSVEVITSGIQASPTNVVEQTWNVTVSGTSITPN